jgi:biotin carboxyl carrier protein
MSGAPQRLRTISDAGVFLVEINAERTRAQVRSETPAESAATNSNPAPGSETTFQLAPIDANVVGVISDRGDSETPAAETLPWRAHVVGSADTTWVFIDGETFTIEVEAAERARGRRGGAGNEGLAAPMPATVIKLLVEPGAEVQRGEVLLLLEAMKMELPIRAPRDGRVKALHCRPGELVQPGTALVDLE